MTRRNTGSGARSVFVRGGARALVAGLMTLGASAPGFAQVFDRASVDSLGNEANDHSYLVSISAHGRYVVFSSAASNLVSNDGNGYPDVFLFDRNTKTTECISVDPSGATGDGRSGCTLFSNSFSSVSDDGRFVAFVSDSTNLVPGITSTFGQLLLRDRTTGLTELISKDASGNVADNACRDPSISPDGRWIVFSSFATNLVSGDTNSHSDVFLYDRSTGVMERESVDSSGVQGNGNCGGPQITADASLVAFTSVANNLVAGDKNRMSDVFVRDRAAGTTVRVNTDSSGVEANSYSFGPALSADGRFVAFSSIAWNLIPGDKNGAWDVFVRDLSTGVVERVSVDSAGGEGKGQSGQFWPPLISADGRFVVFNSDAPNLVSGDTNDFTDVFVRDRSAGTTIRATVNGAGVEADSASLVTGVTADGLTIAMLSSATNLIANDTNVLDDVFVRDDHHAAWTDYGAGFPGTLGIPSLTAQTDPVLGANLTVDVANSSGQPTVGLLLVGTQRANLPTRFGGTLLVLPDLVGPIFFNSGPATFVAAVPRDFDLAGAVLDVQAVEVDPGAANGLSFTAGLELTFGL